MCQGRGPRRRCPTHREGRIPGGAGGILSRSRKERCNLGPPLCSSPVRPALDQFLQRRTRRGLGSSRKCPTASGPSMGHSGGSFSANRPGRTHPGSTEPDLMLRLQYELLGGPKKREAAQPTRPTRFLKKSGPPASRAGGIRAHYRDRRQIRRPIKLNPNSTAVVPPSGIWCRGV